MIDPQRKIQQLEKYIAFLEARLKHSDELLQRALVDASAIGSMMSDKGYELSTHEKQAEFDAKRNYSSTISSGTK